MINHIPLSFIKKLTQLNWRELLWGYQNNFITWQDVVAFACTQIELDNMNPIVVDIAGCSAADAHELEDHLKNLVKTEADVDEEWVTSKWLYLLLAWIYENRSSLNDCLGLVEIVYANFDYPEDVAAFVRYMPVTEGYDPSLHSASENNERLLKLWAAYLDQKAALFGVVPDEARG